jgi:hypothetical protein
MPLKTYPRFARENRSAGLTTRAIRSARWAVSRFYCAALSGKPHDTLEVLSRDFAAGRSFVRRN